MRNVRTVFLRLLVWNPSPCRLIATTGAYDPFSALSNRACTSVGRAAAPSGAFTGVWGIASNKQSTRVCTVVPCLTLLYYMYSYLRILPIRQKAAIQIAFIKSLHESKFIYSPVLKIKSLCSRNERNLFRSVLSAQYIRRH